MNRVAEINRALRGQRIDPSHFSELEYLWKLAKQSPMREENLKRSFALARFIQIHEIAGWRNKTVTKKLWTILLENQRNSPLRFYAFFCPSYRKGINEVGFRTDGVGETTKRGLYALKILHQYANRLGFISEPPLAIFFDLAIEQFNAVIAQKLLTDLEKNFQNFKKEATQLNSEIIVQRLSHLDNFIQKIGIKGVHKGPLGVPKEIFKRVVQRGRLFYRLFGWTDSQVIERSKIICRSESLVGAWLRQTYPFGIMLYTPTMLERLFVYSGMDYRHDPLPIITIKPNIGAVVIR